MKQATQLGSIIGAGGHHTCDARRDLGHGQGVFESLLPLRLRLMEEQQGGAAAHPYRRLGDQDRHRHEAVGVIEDPLTGIDTAIGGILKLIGETCLTGTS